MRQIAAGLFQQLFNVLHRLFRLGARVAQPNQIAVKIGTHLAANVHGVSRAHRLAQIVIERLIGIGFFGVKHPNTGMGWHRSRPQIRR